MSVNNNNNNMSMDSNYCNKKTKQISNMSTMSVESFMTSHSSMSASILDDEFQRDIRETYQLRSIIGQGTFGTVRKCKHRDTHQMLACKTIRKDKVPNVELLKREIDILRQVQHPHIIQLYDVFEEPDVIHLVTELCTGGELYDRVIEKTQSPEGHFSEWDAARIIRNILSAMEYCHASGIVHRDLKPENFLLLNEQDDAPVKIIDFGLSRRVSNDDENNDPLQVMSSRVGTAYYVAPEVLTQERYTNKCDIWSIGVILYVLLCGYPPFHHDNERETLRLVKQGKVDFSSCASWDDISPQAKAFVRRLLERDPLKRPTATEALQDPWLHQDQVQPLGVSKRATFVSPSRRVVVPPTSSSSPAVDATTKAPAPSTPLRMKNQKKVSAFQKFLVAIKVKKRSVM